MKGGTKIEQLSKANRCDEGGSDEDAADSVLLPAFYAARKDELEKRLSKTRFEHSLQVAHVAEQLAIAYGEDERKARLAGLLHDWDKHYDDVGIRQRVLDLELEVDTFTFEQMPLLLHGFTAAKALSREYPELPQDILRAIELHTVSAVGMSNLDMIVYVADAIEPTRRYSSLANLREMVGKVSLEALFLETLQQILLNLISRKKRVYPKTLEVWNYYIARAREVSGNRSKKGLV